MGFLSTILKRATPNNPSFDINSAEAWDAFDTGKSDTGENVNRKTALGYSPVWRGVNLISRDVGKLPLITYERTYQSFGEGKERAVSHPAYRPLRWKANSEMTAFVWKQTIMGHALIEGNGYSYIFRDGAGRPLELVPLFPDQTYPVRENGVLMYVTHVNGTPRKLDRMNVVHIKGLSYDGLCGYSVIKCARDSLSLGMAASKFGRILFKNNARPSVVLEHPTKLQPKAVEELRSSWERMHTGLDNAHKTAILTEGLKAHILSFNAEDSQFLQTRQFEIREVANWFGVPPHKLGDTTRTAFASLEQENQAYLDEALDPWLVAWEEECRDKLLTEEEKDRDSHVVEFMRQALVRADMATRYNSYSIGINNGFLNPNEARARENLNPYEGGDEFRFPLNMSGATNSQGGDDGDNKKTDQDDDQDTEEDDAQGERARAVSALVVDVVRRMTKRVNLHGVRASKKADGYLAWLESIEQDHRSVIESACQPVEATIRSLLNPTYSDGTLSTWLIRSLVDAWNGLADQVTEEKLPTAAMALAKRLEEELPASPMIIEI